jgi:hypothetical protein
MICRSVPIDVCCRKDRDRRSVVGRRYPYLREIQEERRTERRVEVWKGRRTIIVNSCNSERIQLKGDLHQSQACDREQITPKRSSAHRN